jgi:hypothetical protein
MAVTNTLEEIKRFRYPVALPAPTLYGQFKAGTTVDMVIAGLLELGFARVWEVARGAEIVSRVSGEYFREKELPKPVISSACPAVVRLIRVRFPELINNILPVDSPMEAAARMAKMEMEEEGCPLDEVGVFFISPCAAKFTAVKNPIGRRKSFVDGVIAISDIYGPLYGMLEEMKGAPRLQKSTGSGIHWAVSGGEMRLLPKRSSLSVDGLVNVAHVLEDVVMGKLKEVDFIEALACVGGCVGGPLTVENPFMAKTRIVALAKRAGQPVDLLPELPEGTKWQDFTWTENLQPQAVLKLDDDLAEAIRKMEALDEIHKSLPGLDCGSCGAPTCRALAEDIVRGQGNEVDCVFKLREKVAELAERMVALSSKLPPSMNEKKQKEGKQ